jgi:Zn-dependent M16 (insulinase) family peptidase
MPSSPFSLLFSHFVLSSISFTQFTHTAFGCEWLHLDSADTCNTFSVAFRTVPASSNGVAHILEHSGA